MAKGNKYIGVLIAGCALVLCAVVALAFCVGSRPVAAYAADDTFETVFPLSDYFQSKAPALISANEGYLAAYDSEQNRLFVRSQSGTAHYDLDGITNVVKVLAVGDHAVLVTGEAPSFTFYSIDLISPGAEAEEKPLLTPSDIYFAASDGTYLYVKNSAGYISIYDEDLESHTLEVDNKLNYDVLAGLSNFAAKDGTIYLFSTGELNAARYYIYDCVNDQVKYDSTSDADVQPALVQSAYVGDSVIFAQISPQEDLENSNRIVCLDKETGAMISVPDVPVPKAFCAYGDSLYTIEGGSIYQYDLDNSDGDYSLEKAGCISMRGDDMRHLNAPKDVALAGGKLAVADSDNYRLALIDLAGGSSLSLIEGGLSAKPVRVDGDDSGVIALLEGGKIRQYSLTGGAFDYRSEYALEGAIDVALRDGFIYALKADGLYMRINDFTKSDEQFTGARRIAACDGGDALYVLFDDEIAVFGSNCRRLPCSLKGDFAEAVDIAADYLGNLTVLYPDRIEQYKNLLTSLEKTSEVQFTSALYSVTASSVELGDGEAYFAAENECLVCKTAATVVNKDEFACEAPTPGQGEPLSFMRPKADVTPIYMPADDARADSAQSLVLAEGESVMAFGALGSPGEGLAYAMQANRLIVIQIAQFEAVTPVSIGKTYEFVSDDAMYGVPYFPALQHAAPTGTRVEAVSDVAGYDGNKWVIVTYDGGRYFAPADKLRPYVAPSEPVAPDGETTGKLYGRAKAGRVGGVVNIYSDLAESDKLLGIVDGKRVEILYEFSDYYKVKYGDVIGFMRKSEVKIGGLTAVQIIAIVLSCVVAVAGAGIFISIAAIKKRNDSAEK